MDVKTGQIKELSPEQIADAIGREQLVTADIQEDDTASLREMKSRWIRLDWKPNPACKKCHGRGWTGYNVTLKEYVPCVCVKKRP